jgi:ribosomal protein S18 acetylase RimI-like enzyme
MTLINYRAGGAPDAEAIACLHVQSWRRHYRGAYPDHYLDGDLESERRAVWVERLSENGDNNYTIVAERDGSVVGFAHTRLDSDPEWGALLDNLHVRYDLKRQGVGSALMARTALILGRRRPESGLYLWVLKQNVAAQAFYQSRGGAPVGERLAGPFPGGGRALVLRYAWPDPSLLLDPSSS